MTRGIWQSTQFDASSNLRGHFDLENGGGGGTSGAVSCDALNGLGVGCRPQLDLRVSVQGGVHFDLVSAFRRQLDRAGLADLDLTSSRPGSAGGSGGGRSWCDR